MTDERVCPNCGAEGEKIRETRNMLNQPCMITILCGECGYTAIGISMRKNFQEAEQEARARAEEIWQKNGVI